MRDGDSLSQRYAEIASNSDATMLVISMAGSTAAGGIAIGVTDGVADHPSLVGVAALEVAQAVLVDEASSKLFLAFPGAAAEVTAAQR